MMLRKFQLCWLADDAEHVYWRELDSGALVARISREELERAIGGGGR